MHLHYLEQELKIRLPIYGGIFIVLNLRGAHVWDDSAVAAVDMIVSKFEENNIIVNVKGLNEDSTELVNKLANQLGSH